MGHICRSDTAFESLIITSCQRTSVVVQHQSVSSDPFTPRPDIQDAKSIHVSFRNVDFINNDGLSDAQSPGGNLGGDKSMIEIDQCRFGNCKGSSGGAILFYGRSLKIQGSNFMGNTAKDAGGAIYASLDRLYDTNGVDESKVQIRDCTFESNKVLFSKIDNQRMTTKESTRLETNRYFDFDSLGDSGGAIYAEGFETVEIVHVVFQQNEAVSAGGAIHVSDNDNITIVSCFFASNAVLPD